MTASLDTPVDSLATTKLFWSAVTGTDVGSGRDAVTLQPPTGDPLLRVRAVEHPPARVHVDIDVDDLATEIRRARSLGARVIAQHHAHSVLASPGGLLFGLARSSTRRQRPPPVVDRGGRSLLDQICIDARPALFESEAAFWSAFTGWERRSGSLPEFDYLVRPEGMPLRVLLQRLGDGPRQPVSAHLDFACDDVTGQVRHHQARGAVLVRRMPSWATMRDPAGREYCLTARDPDTGVISD
jgi:hypothetical protein